MLNASIIALIALIAQEPAANASRPPTPDADATAVGPRRGSLVIVGGGELGPDIVKRFVTLAGGKDAEVVVIPTAAENDPVDVKRVADGFARSFGFKPARLPEPDRSVHHGSRPSNGGSLNRSES